MNRSAFHEDFTQEDVRPGSERVFGLLLSGFFAFIAVLKVLRENTGWVLYGAAAVVFLSLALIKPQILAPLNRLWLKLGLLLYRIVNPVVMAVLFYGTIFPVGLIMRLVRRDPLRLAYNPQVGSYWIERRPPGPSPETMRQQF